MKVTIITPALNAAGTLEDCLNSVDSQSFPDIEHLVVDGGSDDDSASITGRSKARFVDRSAYDRGMYDAINYGIDLSCGDVIGILNADDVYTDRAVIGEVMEVMNRDQVDIVYGDLRYIDHKGRTVRKWKAGEMSRRKFRLGWMPPHPTVFVKRTVYEEFGNYRLDMGTSGDYEFLLRTMFRYGVTSGYISRDLVRMRTGGMSNASWENRLRANRMDRKAWEVNGLRPGWMIQVLKPLSKIGQWI